MRQVSACWSVLAVAGWALVFTGCGSKSGSAPTASIEGGEAVASAPSTPGETTRMPSLEASTPRPAPNLHPTVAIQTSLGTIKVKLNAEKSPQTVDNFLDNYVSRNFYNDTIFHYVDKKMVLGGGYTAALEPKEVRAPIRNEADNGLKNVRGTIAMARTPDYPDTASSQFFFNVADNPNLDHQDDDVAKFGYCVFGEVIEGLDVLDQIAAAQVKNEGDFVNTPAKPILIQAITRID